MLKMVFPRGVQGPLWPDTSQPTSLYSTPNMTLTSEKGSSHQTSLSIQIPLKAQDTVHVVFSSTSLHYT